MSTSPSVFQTPAVFTPFPATIERTELLALIDAREARNPSEGSEVEVGGRRFVLLEALGEPYFRKGHLPGARQLTYDRAAVETTRLGLRPEDDIVVYCASNTCENSHVAAAALATAGFRHVRVYAEGKQGWQEAGLPLVRD